MEERFLIVGLGNPGAEYARTRHNAGFMAVELLGQRRAVKWDLETKFSSRLARTEFEGRMLMLCEPQTYMNASGEAVGLLVEFFKIPVRQLLVVVDDADLQLGAIRLRGSGSSGGHHGLESIEQRLGTREYARLRIGIGRQPGAARRITNYVLGRFSADDLPLLEKILNRVADQIECWVTRGITPAMNQFNGAIEAPSEKES
jgi:peptidyl-tRNA hydrolase, PTH1 family